MKALTLGGYGKRPQLNAEHRALEYLRDDPAFLLVLPASSTSANAYCGKDQPGSSDTTFSQLTWPFIASWVWQASAIS
jgi:hypothetical protein